MQKVTVKNLTALNRLVTETREKMPTEGEACEHGVVEAIARELGILEDK